MTPLSLVLTAAMLVLSIVIQRRSGDWRPLAASVVVLAMGCIAVAGRGLESDLIDPLDLVYALVVGAFAVIAFGVPGFVARRLGWPSGPRWEFDRRLGRLIDEFDDLVRAYPGPTDQDRAWAWAHRVLERGPHIAARMRSLRAPSSEWQQMANDYAAFVELALQAMRDGATGPRDDLDYARADLDQRRSALRRAYPETPRHET